MHDDALNLLYDMLVLLHLSKAPRHVVAVDSMELVAETFTPFSFTSLPFTAFVLPLFCLLMRSRLILSSCIEFATEVIGKLAHLAFV